MVRRAYYDNRRRDGHRNSVVFMVEIKGSVSPNVFKGCQVGSSYSSPAHYRPSKQYWWGIHKDHVTSNVSYVDCFDVYGVNNGDSAFLAVTELKVGAFILREIMVKSQRNLVVPEHREDDVPHDHPSLVSCVATVRMGDFPPSKDGMLYISVVTLPENNWCGSCAHDSRGHLCDKRRFGPSNC